MKKNKCLGSLQQRIRLFSVYDIFIGEVPINLCHASKEGKFFHKIY